jgi:hypothetical protein
MSAFVLWNFTVCVESSFATETCTLGAKRMIWHGPTQLYRHFSASGELLYVGAGPCVLCRVHARRHAIWYSEIATICAFRAMTDTIPD